MSASGQKRKSLIRFSDWQTYTQGLRFRYGGYSGRPASRKVEASLSRKTAKGSLFASFFSKISDAFHVLFDPLANHLEGLFLRFSGHLR
jgi:hypothetical protein